MVKMLRKYNKWVLAVFGTLLMISFMAPQAVQQLRGDPMKRVVATMNGAKIRASDLHKANLEYKALETFFEPLMKDSLAVENGEHWFLLAKEAEDAGLVGEDQDGRLFEELLARDFAVQIKQAEYYNQFRQFGEDFARQFSGQMARSDMNDPEKSKQAIDRAAAVLRQGMQRGAGEARMTENEFYRALAKARGVSRLRSAYGTAARVSDREAITRAAESEDQTFADVVVIPAARALEGIPEATPEQIQANFEKFRDAAPGEGEMGLGYRRPNRVKIEYLELDRSVFEAAATVDPVEVRKRQTKDRAADPKGFAEERAKIEADLRNERATQYLSDADKLVVSSIRAQVRKLENEGEFKKLPADWTATRAGFEAIAQKVVEGMKTSHGITIPLPKVVSMNGSWLTAEDLAKLGGVGAATLRVGPKTVSLPQAVMDVKELAGRGAGVGLQAQVPQIEPPFTDEQQNRYYITILDARMASAPDSLDEVRDEVARNVRLLAAFDRLKAEAEKYKQLAASDGLEAVGKLFETTPPAAVPDKPATPDPSATPGPLPVQKAVSVTRDAVRSGDAELNRPELREAARAAGAALDPTTPADSVPAAQRTFAVPLPHNTSLAVGMVVGRRPLTAELYRTLADRGYDRYLAMQDLQTAAGDQNPMASFSFKALSERLGFKMKGAQDKD